MPMELPLLKSKIADLQVAVEGRLPNYTSLLQLIHRSLADQTELSYRLDDAEIAVIISGMERYHEIEISEPKMKKPMTKAQGRLISSDDV